MAASRQLMRGFRKSDERRRFVQFLQRGKELLGLLYRTAVISLTVQNQKRRRNAGRIFYRRTIPKLIRFLKQIMSELPVGKKRNRYR